MSEKETTLKTDDGGMTTFTVHPDGPGPYPVAVLYMDGVGYREQIKENARRFAAGGFYVVAPDLFYRAGKHVQIDMDRIRAEGMNSPAGQQLMKVIAEVKPGRVMADTSAIFEMVASDPAASSGPKVCVGYCMGARLSLHAASAMPRDFVAAACIHPGALVTDQPDSPHHDLATVRGELYVAFAEIDRTATPESIDEFRAEMEGRGVRGKVERIAGATHGFAMADLAMYDRDAAERHFAKTLDLWQRSLN
ncbi:MAG TPA: dienelactone hydrolase family protein [Candidatus Dormibacteraeota bacterium]|nr:dienelactone hydrolase family protein [Candidatus Dormibacteraeota bacterium]